MRATQSKNGTHMKSRGMVRLKFNTRVLRVIECSALVSGENSTVTRDREVWRGEGGGGHCLPRNCSRQIQFKVLNTSNCA